MLQDDVRLTRAGRFGVRQGYRLHGGPIQQAGEDVHVAMLRCNCSVDRGVGLRPHSCWRGRGSLASRVVRVISDVIRAALPVHRRAVLEARVKDVLGDAEFGEESYD